MKTTADRVLKWMMSGDTGISSKSICAHMTDTESKDYGSYPSDPSDLGRCLRLLELFPEWKARITEMAKYGTGWIGLVAKWDELAQMMADEVGIDWSKGRSAPLTYEAMQAAIADGYRADADYKCTFSADGNLQSATRIRK